MKLATICFRLAIALALAVPAERSMAQQPSGTITAASMDAFAAAHVEVAALRSKAQAELAEPRSKKADVQTSLREKLHESTLRVLKAHGLTEAEFARLTRLVSTDDALRKQFDEAVARFSTGKGASTVPLHSEIDKVLRDEIARTPTGAPNI